MIQKIVDPRGCRIGYLTDGLFQPIVCTLQSVIQAYGARQSAPAQPIAEKSVQVPLVEYHQLPRNYGYCSDCSTSLYRDHSRMTATDCGQKLVYTCPSCGKQSRPA